MPRIPRQTIAPEPFTKKDLAESNWRELVVKISDSAVVLRYLTSKLVYTEETFTSVDSVTLFCAFEEVMLKMSRDEAFRAKYGPETFVFRSIFQSLDYLVKLHPSERRRELEECYSFYRGKLFSRRYYYAVEGQSKRLYQTLVRQRFPKTFPAKAYIGKGYGDNGTAKDKVFDGSPSWQEVASDRRFQEAIVQPAKAVDYHRVFQVHELQRFGASKSQPSREGPLGTLNAKGLGH